MQSQLRKGKDQDLSLKGKVWEGTSSRFSVLKNLEEDGGDTLEEVEVLKAKINPVIGPSKKI